MKPTNYIKVGMVTAIACFGTMSTSHAAIAVAWSGGNGSPLSVTFSAPVEFQVTGTPLYEATFLLVGVGDLTSNTIILATGMTYSINGTDFNITGARSGYDSIYDTTANDLIIWGGGPLPTIGDTMILNPGTLTLTGDYAGTPPADGDINMFITNGLGGNISPAGVSVVPELSSALLGGMGLLSLLRRRR